MKIKNTFKAFLNKIKIDKKLEIALSAFLAVVMLIIFFKSISNNTSKSSNQKEVLTTNEICGSKSESYEQNVENRIKKMVKAVDGVSEAEVFVMTECSTRFMYATDIENNSTTDGTKSNKTTNETIVLSKDGTTTEPIIVVEQYPEIKGVLVVANGLKNEKMRLMLINALSVALNIESSKIEVLAN